MNRVDQIVQALIEGDDDFDFDPKEVYPEGSFNELFSLMEKGILDLSGTVERHNNHYVHERSTDCSLREDYNWPDDVPYEVRQTEEERLGVIINQLEKQIDERMVDWNRKIYQELEASYEDSISEEVVADNIRANEYTFDEDGNRDDDGGFQYNQLGDDAKETARQWYVEGHNDDNYWAEYVIAEWRWLLWNKGFEGVEINYSGFWSQGDGASFTAKHIDFKRYFSFPDPLEFPESDREQMDESLKESEEDFDPKDVGTPVFGKPFGYVLRSQTPGTGYPWFNTRWSDRADCCGNFRRYIGDAKVYKRLSAARSYSSLDVVPIYSDPRKTGENALNPGYVPKPRVPLPPMQEAEDDVDMKDVSLPSTPPEVANDILQRLQAMPQVSDATVMQGTVNPEHTIINGRVNADHWDGGHLVDQAIFPSMDIPTVTIIRSVAFAAPQDVYARGFSVLVKPMVRESLTERYGGSQKERQLFYHGTSAKLLPKIMAEGLIPEPKVRSWGDDPHKGLIQPTRKSLPGIYVTTNLMTAVSAAGRVSRRDKANRLIVVMELQPRDLLADEDDITGTINALAQHISDHVYSHIWPYFAEVYRDRMRHSEEYGPRADQAKAKWVDDAVKQMLYKFGGDNPELEARLRDLLANEGYRAMLTRMASYAGDWEKGHWVSEWRHLFGTDEDVPPVPNPQEAEEAFLAFKDKLTHTLKGKARPLMQKDWKLNVSGRSMKPIGFTGRDHIVCIVEEIDEREPTYRTRMLVHYGKPPQQLVKDWTEGHGPLDQPDSIVYKNVSEAFEPHHRAMARTGFWGTQAAGGVFIAQDSGRILIGFRSGDVLQPHTWGSFGGAMDEGEDPAVAAKREMVEETGYNGPMTMVPLYVFEKDTFKYHNFAALVPTEFKPQLNWENDDAQWVKFGEWPDPLHFGLAALIQHSGEQLQLRENEDEDFDVKDTVEHPPIPPMEVSSSHGNFKVNPDTGEILELELFDEHDPESQDYKNIAKFDMAEWKKTYGAKWPPEDPAGMNVDILDLGAWLTDGSYVPPDEEWRRGFREGRGIRPVQETDDEFDQKDVTIPDDASIYLRHTYDDLNDPNYPPVWESDGPFCTVDGAVEWAQKVMAPVRDKLTLLELVVVVDGNVVKRYVLDQDFQLRQESPIGGWEQVRESEDEFGLDDFDLKDVAASANIWSVTYHYPDWRKTRYSMGLPRHHPQGSANIVFYSPDTVDSKVVAMKTWQREQLGPNPNHELRRRGQMLLRVFQKLAQKHGDQDVLQFTNAWDWAEAHGEDRDQMMARIDAMVAESEDDFDVKDVADFSPDDLTLTPTFMETAYTTSGDLDRFVSKLADVVNWPELYRAYPALADMPVAIRGFDKPLQIMWNLRGQAERNHGLELQPKQTAFILGRSAFDDPPSRLERRFAWAIKCAIDVLQGRAPNKEAAKEWATGKTKSRWPEDYQYGFDQRQVEEAAEDDFELKDVAEPPQTWTYHIFRFTTVTAINYYLVTDPAHKDVPLVINRAGIARKWPNWDKLSKTVGGHTFPRKMPDRELHQIAQAQIRQFERTGTYDPARWNNVWEWMRAARETGQERKPLPWDTRRRGNTYRHV